MLKPTEKLDKYLSSVTLDFMRQTNYIEYIVSVEQERQINTKMGIIALFKIYKGITLSTEEKELLTKYPLENDQRINLERQIAFIAFNIGQESWNKVNNMRLEMIDYEKKNNIGTWKMFDYDCNVTYDRKKCFYIRKVTPSESYKEYLDYLEEYNRSLIHAWSYKHDISLITPTRKQVKPKIDLDSEYFEEDRTKTNKIISLIKKISKRN